MKRLVLLASLTLLVPGGCPNDGGNGGNSPAVARIGTSSTTGPAPLRVTFTAVDSSSSAGDIVRYAWDFGDGTGSDQLSPTHDFGAPGRYLVSLDVEDSAGNVGTATVEIRAAGGPATAVISATPTSGRAPLSVRFDGRGSNAPDDTIVDYRWSFDDGTFAQTPAPIHVFLQNGTYDVTLQVTTGGGVEAIATQRISVGGILGSLQFNGTQLANLPLPAAQNLSALTLETWFNADAEGGAALSIGTGAMVIRIEPGAGRVVVQLRGTDYPASSANL
jgi:PKD repeat protein